MASVAREPDAVNDSATPGARRFGDPTYVHPRPGAWGRGLERLLGCHAWSRLRRRVFARLPFVRLASDVRDVVYLNWLVPAERVSAFVPAGQRLQERDGQAVLTVLSYRHGGFGPDVPHWLRRWLPSPLQSNWRLYLDDAPGVQGAVLFIDNVMDSLAHVVAARLFSDALPAHLASVFEHRRVDDGYDTRIESGSGSAPDLHCRVDDASVRALPDDWARWFPDWPAAVAALSLRECAVVRMVDRDGQVVAGIELPVDVERAVALTARAGSFRSRALQPLVGDAVPFCFAVRKVPFKVLSERVLAR